MPSSRSMCECPPRTANAAALAEIIILTRPEQHPRPACARPADCVRGGARVCGRVRAARGAGAGTATSAWRCRGGGRRAAARREGGLQRVERGTGGERGADGGQCAQGRWGRPLYRFGGGAERSRGVRRRMGHGGSRRVTCGTEGCSNNLLCLPRSAGRVPVLVHAVAV